MGAMVKGHGVSDVLRDMIRKVRHFDREVTKYEAEGRKGLRLKTCGLRCETGDMLGTFLQYLFCCAYPNVFVPYVFSLDRVLDFTRKIDLGWLETCKSEGEVYGKAMDVLCEVTGWSPGKE